jgi:hypothetical protein
MEIVRLLFHLAWSFVNHVVIFLIQLLRKKISTILKKILF